MALCQAAHQVRLPHAQGHLRQREDGQKGGSTHPHSSSSSSSVIRQISGCTSARRTLYRVLPPTTCRTRHITTVCCLCCRAAFISYNDTNRVASSRAGDTSPLPRQSCCCCSVAPLTFITLTLAERVDMHQRQWPPCPCLWIKCAVKCIQKFHR